MSDDLVVERGIFSSCPQMVGFERCGNTHISQAIDSNIKVFSLATVRTNEQQSMYVWCQRNRQIIGSLAAVLDCTTDKDFGLPSYFNPVSVVLKDTESNFNCRV